MNFSSDAANLLRILTYPFTFGPESILRDKIDRIYNIIDGPNGDVPTSKYLAAVREALASENNLSELLCLDHSDNAIREFLSVVEQRLAARVAGT